jgi:hypothetical protein
MCGEQRQIQAGTEGDQARWTLARKLLRTDSPAKRSVKTSTGDISVADDAMGDWGFRNRNG